MKQKEGNYGKGWRGIEQTPVGIVAQVRPRKSRTMRRLTGHPTESARFPGARSLPMKILLQQAEKRGTHQSASFIMRL